MDLFEETKAEFRYEQAELLNRQLETCSLYVDLASESHKQGDLTSAALATACAENGYVTVVKLLSDPQCSRHLTIKASLDFKKQVGGLRRTLDGLQRLREKDRPRKAS